MSVVTEPFTGTNGAGPPSPWVAVTLSGSQSIQSNKWRISNGDGYQGTALTRGTTSYTDVDITTEITLDAQGEEQYPGVGARLSGGTSGWAPYAEAYNGYVAYLHTPLNEVHVQRETAGSAVVDSGAPVTLAAGGTYKLRFQLIGSTIRARAWNASAGEPSTWAVSITDATYSSGLVGFRDQSPSNTCTSDWDNFVIDDAPAGGGGSGTLGTAASVLTFAAAGTGLGTHLGSAATGLVFAASVAGATPGFGGGGSAVVAAIAGRG